MPIRWSSSPTKANSPLFRALLSSISKSSSQQALKSTFPRSAKSTLNNTSKLGSRSFQSTPPNQNLRSLTSLASISKSIALAGTGTVVSTFFALYLATRIENLAHETLYEYFPHKYYEIADEDLPHCLKDREMMRRYTGEVTSERVKGRVWDDSYLSVDGWVIPDKDVGASELLAEEVMEGENTSELSSWQRRMTEKRDLIIQQEEREFVRAESASGMSKRNNSSWSLWGESTRATDRQLMERRRMQEEMAKKFQESLMSTAMTA